MIVYGYARVSTKRQDLQRQIKNIKATYPDAVILQEEYTGTTMERPEFNKLMKKIKPGNVIVFDSVSRMSRDASEGMELYEKLYLNGIELVFLKEPHINTTVYKSALENQIQYVGDDVDFILEGVNKYLLCLAKKQIQIAFEQAEKEVKDLQQRTKEGIEIARLNGKQIGQRRGAKLNVKKKPACIKKIRQLSRDFEGSNTDVECMKLIGISRNTYYKYKREIKQ